MRTTLKQARPRAAARAAALATLACGALACAAPASAETSPWSVRVGAAHVGFDASADVSVNGTPVPGGSAHASDNTTLGLEIAYSFTDDLAARLLVGVPPTTHLSGTGTLASAGELGRVQYGPAVLSVTYALGHLGPVRPYVGAGVNYTIVFKSEDAFIANLDVPGAFGSVVEAGLEMPLGDGWSIGFDARKIFLKTKADGVLPAMGGASTHADVRLDPLVLFASVGKQF